MQGLRAQHERVEVEPVGARVPSGVRRRPATAGGDRPDRCRGPGPRRARDSSGTRSRSRAARGWTPPEPPPGRGSSARGRVRPGAAAPGPRRPGAAPGTCRGRGPLRQVVPCRRRSARPRSVSRPSGVTNWIGSPRDRRLDGEDLRVGRRREPGAERCIVMRLPTGDSAVGRARRCAAVRLRASAAPRAGRRPPTAARRPRRPRGTTSLVVSKIFTARCRARSKENPSSSSATWIRPPALTT